MWVADGLVTGELFDMEAGPVGFALGTQYRRESLSYDYDEFTNAGDRLFVGQASDFDNTRDVYAVFGEVAVPVSEDLDVQLALRFEEYGGPWARRSIRKLRFSTVRTRPFRFAGHSARRSVRRVFFSFWQPDKLAIGG